MHTKICSLDPMPTKLVKERLNILAPVLGRIVNASFDSGVFPDCCKEAIITPLLKDSRLDRTALNNYGPVSNCCS